MFLVTVPKFRRAGLCCRVRQHILQRHFEDGGEIYFDDVHQRIFAPRNGQPVATGINALARQFHRESVGRKARDRVIDPQELRHADAVFHQDFHTPSDQFGVNILSHTDADIGGNLQAMRRFEDEEGDRIGSVLAARSGPPS